MNPKFYKGMPALNPKGRPKGIVNKYTLLAREMMTEKGPDVVDKVIEMALDGDVHCLKMCIDRILPVHKAVDPNRIKSDSNIVINVGASADIKAKLADTNPNDLIDPTIKSPDEIVIEVAETIK